MSLRFTSRSLAQLADIFDYIAKENPRAAQSVLTHIKASIGKLESFPFMGHVTDVPRVRILNLTRYPYRIFYRAYGENDVVILRILHAARNQ